VWEEITGHREKRGLALMVVAVVEFRNNWTALVRRSGSWDHFHSK
jgi:hypothetical protein